MKIEKESITFTDNQEIDDLKVALVMASNNSLDYLRYAAEDPTRCFNNILVENKSSTEETISTMFVSAMQSYRVIELSKQIVTAPTYVDKLASAKNYFSTIKEFCKREASRIRTKS
jgi:hypothetical protein